jgi:hypothetical protein
VGREYTPTLDGWFDPISLEIDPGLGTEDEFRRLVRVAADHQALAGGSLVPLHTGTGPDFRLAQCVAGGDVVKNVHDLGARVVRLDAVPFLGIEPKPGGAETRHYLHPLFVTGTDTLAMLARKLGGWSFHELNVPQPKDRGVCLLVLKLPGRGAWAVTALDFGRAEVAEELDLAAVPGLDAAAVRGRAVKDTVTGQPAGAVNDAGRLTIGLGPQTYQALVPVTVPPA